MTSFSIVEFLYEKTSHNCGYCSGRNSSTSAGMWAHALTVDDYEAMVYRNWRRSGCYCYHPCMNITCCPSYMVQCDAVDFKLSKHQKKVIKRFNRYMMTGSVSADTANIASASPSVLASGEMLTNGSESCVNSQPASESTSTKPSVAAGVGADPNKPRAIKAKVLRQQKKEQKQGAQAMPVAKPSNKKNEAKSLHQLLAEYDPNKAVHKFETRLVRSHPPSHEFIATVHEELEVYQKYQMAIHGDPLSKVSMENFQGFLINSPLKECVRSGVQLGSFHYQYVVDGKIIAVEVMDILPRCISSKYFFYNPDYEFLTLGTYSVFRSVHLIRELQTKLDTLRYYLMGFYIHSCPKMKYKANFSPSFLLCPETYQWIPIERCLPLLDAHKYSRLCPQPDLEDREKPEDVNHTLCLQDRQISKYGDLRRKSSSKKDVSLYASLLGRTLSTRMLLYQS